MLAVSALLAVPFALIGRTLSGLVLSLLFAVLFIGRYVPGWVSNPPPAPATPLTVSAWNVEGAPDAARRVLSGVGDLQVDLLGLEELQPAMSDALLDDPEFAARYPYHVLAPQDQTLGVGFFSRYPIDEQTTSIQPTFIRATVSVPDHATPLVVFIVHPLRGALEEAFGVPWSIDTTQRDQDQALMHELIQADVDAGRTVLVMGDLNTTEREPAYAEFSAGLRDAQLTAGRGPGLTWRPDPLKSLPFGLIRIDYVFSTPDLVATSMFVDCTPFSDHCRVQAAFR